MDVTSHQVVLRYKSGYPTGRSKTVYVWNMPELALEICELLSSAGEATLKECYDSFVKVRILLHCPVWNNRSETEGLRVDGWGLVRLPVDGYGSLLFDPIPEYGDQGVTFQMVLKLETSDENQQFTLDDMRTAIRLLAEKMKEGWNIQG